MTHTPSVRSSLYAAVACLLLVASASQAAPQKQVIDIAHSTLDFTVASFLIDAEGTFKSWRGEVTLDQENIENSSVHVTINAASIDTRIDKRDAHLKSADFFDVERYPNIIFKSTKLKKTGNKTLDMTGDLTLHGVTKAITIPVTIDRLQDNYSRFRGVVTVNRAEFGIDYNSKLNPIENEVKIEMVINIKNPD